MTHLEKALKLSLLTLRPGVLAQQCFCRLATFGGDIGIPAKSFLARPPDCCSASCDQLRAIMNKYSVGVMCGFCSCYEKVFGYRKHTSIARSLVLEFLLEKALKLLFLTEIKNNKILKSNTPTDNNFLENIVNGFYH